LVKAYSGKTPGISPTRMEFHPSSSTTGMPDPSGECSIEIDINYHATEVK
jgi:hypothetical protein